MKRRKLIQWIVYTAFILFVTFAVCVLIPSCHDDPPLPDCELYNYGWVLVENETGYDGLVDVTEGEAEENYEVFLHSGESYEYAEVLPGPITIWITLDLQEWYFEYEDLSTCEDLTFTWYLEAKKSSKLVPIGVFYDGNQSITVEGKLKIKQKIVHKKFFRVETFGYI